MPKRVRRAGRNFQSRCLLAQYYRAGLGVCYGDIIGVGYTTEADSDHFENLETVSADPQIPWPHKLHTFEISYSSLSPLDILLDDPREPRYLQRSGILTEYY